MGALDILHDCWLQCYRILTQFLSSLVLGLVYGKSKTIPPIRNQLLLEPATKLAEKIRKGQVKSQDVTQAYIDRIKEVQPILNAIVDERFEGALEDAKKVDELIASGTKTEEEIAENTPFLGVPFSCKEHIAVEGFSYTCGLVSRKGIKAEEDSDVVKRLKKSGAIPLVATNIPELCMWWESGNNVYGVTRNPYDTRKTCGGSSGGEGALISSCGSIFGLGSDYGGSIRVPAMMNGVFGHKPSSGVVPHNGYYFEYPENIRQYFVIGPLCRYAVDLKPIMKVLTDNLPRLALDSPVDFRKLKIFYAEDCGYNPRLGPVVPEVKSSIRKALLHFENEYGVETCKADLPGLCDSFSLWFHVIMEGKPPRFTEKLTEGKGRINVSRELFKWCFGQSNHTFHALFFSMMEESAMKCSSEEHAEGLVKFAKFKEEFDELLKDDCVFIYPTMNEPAPFRHETVLKYPNLDYTGIFNVLNYPSTHVPTSFHKGMPVGIQCIANRFNDRLTMAVATELETVFGGWHPPTETDIS